MCSEIYLEASRRQEKRRLRLVQRDMAFEHIAVEVHRTIQVEGMMALLDGLMVATDLASSGFRLRVATGVRTARGEQC
jgi:hypothetical protein